MCLITYCTGITPRCVIITELRHKTKRVTLIMELHNASEHILLYSKTHKQVRCCTSTMVGVAVFIRSCGVIAATLNSK